MELLKLSWDQIDFSLKKLTLWNQDHITKSKKIRVVPLNKKALEILTKRQEVSKNCRVFTYNKNEINPDYLQHKFKDYLLKAKLNSKLHFHSLRHSFASWLVQGNVSIYLVSKLLGHSSVKTTERYAHLNSEHLENSLELINI
jgi:integrase